MADISRTILIAVDVEAEIHELPNGRGVPGTWRITQVRSAEFDPDKYPTQNLDRLGLRTVEQEDGDTVDPSPPYDIPLPGAEEKGYVQCQGLALQMGYW